MGVSRSPHSVAMPREYPTGMPSSSAMARAPNTIEVMLSSVNMAASKLLLHGVVIFRLVADVGLHQPEAGERERHRNDHVDPLHGNVQRQAGLRPVERALHEHHALPDHEQIE